MEDKNKSKPEGKPFSVLEKFRQLKKDKEQGGVPEPTEPVRINQETPETVFQASSSSSPTNGDLRVKEGPRTSRGWPRGKRNFPDSSFEKYTKKTAADLYKGQKETDVGITEFIRDGPGFDVILKHRYTDFHVNEITKDKKIVKLTSIEIPENDEGSETLTEEEDPEVLTPEQWDTLREIVEKKLADCVKKDVTDLSKEERQRVHKGVKRRFGAHIFSNTDSVDSRKIMRIGFAGGQAPQRITTWPQGRPEYLHFILYKENCEMMEAVSVISKFTHTKATKFGYAGTKDKRAVTSQQMCVQRGNVDRFRKCSTLRGIAIGNYCYRWGNLRLGDLSGNRFKLALRFIKVSDDVIRDAIDQLKQKGFINYFGMQRFGQSALVPTYAVGQAILKGDWKLATELVLKPRPGENTFKDLEMAREIWWTTRNASEALKPLTRKDKTLEGRILLVLKKHGPNAYQNAFDTLPRHTFTLFLHSYQSLVWNRVVSRRVQKFGLQVLPGDLVIVDPVAAVKFEVLWQENDKLSDDESDDGDMDDVFGSGKIQVRSLTADEAKTTSIHDIVYPLPGDDVRLPENEVADWYTELLGKDGHSMGSFGKLNKKVGMFGTYRKMLETVEDLSWHTLRYSDPDDDLILSDLDILKGKPPPVLDPDGPYKALIIEFNLKVCCYATMAIRELAKCETSTSSQALLTYQVREEDLAAKRQKMEEKVVTKNSDMVIDSETQASSDCKKDNCEVETKIALKCPTQNGDKDSMVVITNEDDKREKDNCNRETQIPCKENSVEREDSSDPGNCSMDTEVEPKTPTHERDPSCNMDDEGEMIKREAEADNIINKYLETNYH